MTEAKFKVGDKVKVIEPGPRYGQTGAVETADDYAAHVNLGSYYFSNRHLELVQHAPRPKPRHVRTPTIDEVEIAFSDGILSVAWNGLVAFDYDDAALAYVQLHGQEAFKQTVHYRKMLDSALTDLGEHLNDQYTALQALEVE